MYMNEIALQARGAHPDRASGPSFLLFWSPQVLRSASRGATLHFRTRNSGSSFLRVYTFSTYSFFPNSEHLACSAATPVHSFTCSPLLQPYFPFVPLYLCGSSTSSTSAQANIPNPLICRNIANFSFALNKTLQIQKLRRSPQPHLPNPQSASLRIPGRMDPSQTLPRSHFRISQLFQLIDLSGV